jgi:hypothetical protein
MWPHFVNLLHRAWANLMAAISSSTFGTLLFSVCVPIVVGVCTFLFGLWVLKQSRRDAFKKAAEALGITLGSTWVVIIIAWIVVVVLTVFSDHQRLSSANTILASQNKDLRADLDWRRHNLSTTDPVFPNIIYMLQAFERFGRVMDVHPQAGLPSCVIYMTWPKGADSARIGALMHQLGGPLTGCAPFASEGDSDLDPELLEGDQDDVIKVHAAKDEPAADALMGSLGNEIRLQRTYRMFKNPEKRWSPYSPQQRVVWLQFGKSVKWNSEYFGKRD